MVGIIAITRKHIEKYCRPNNFKGVYIDPLYEFPYTEWKDKIMDYAESYYDPNHPISYYNYDSINDFIDKMNKDYQNEYDNIVSLYIYGNTFSGECLPRLTQIPRLPKSLKFLYCYDTDITELPELPSELMLLTIYRASLLTKLPILPDSLIHLHIFDDAVTEINQLSSNLITLNIDNTKKLNTELPNSLKLLDCAVIQLPELPNGLEALTYTNYDESLTVTEELYETHSNIKLPNSVKHFVYSSWPFETLPIKLHNNIKHLSLYYCDKLNKLPYNLPSSIETLYCQYNNLTELPDNLPSNLIELNCIRNKLIKLPDNLPSNLKRIDCSKNNLIELPDNLPIDLEKLIISKNNIKKLPYSILNTRLINKMKEDYNFANHLFNCDDNPLKTILEKYKMEITKKIATFGPPGPNNPGSDYNDKMFDLERYIKELKAVETISNWFLECKYNPAYAYCRKIVNKGYNDVYS